MVETFLAAIGVGEILVILVFISKAIVDRGAARSFALLLVATIFYLIHHLLPEQWINTSYSIQTAIPALFWLTSHLLFTEKPDLKQPLACIAYFSAIMPTLGRPFEHSEFRVLAFFVWDFPQLLESVLLTFGVYEIVKNWNSDLVESRRKLRLSFISTISIATGVSILSFHYLPGITHISFLAVDVALLIVSWSILHSGKDLWRPVKANVSEALLVKAEDPHAQSTSQQEINNEEPPLDNDHLGKQVETCPVRSLMESGYYRNEHLTLSTLAKEMDLAEHKVRAIINKKMGYRNFNQYLNDLRIKEASNRLAAEPDTPIANIALDVGYRNISSFNRSFKAIHQLSPTEFRSSHT